MTWLPSEPPRPPEPPRLLEPPSDLRVLASDLRFPEGPIACTDGSLLVVEVRGGALTRISADGRADVVADLGGGPNGAAVGPDGAVYVCNNGGLPWSQLPDGSWYPFDPATGSMQPPDYTHGWIERVDLETGLVDRIYQAAGDRELSAPNDIAFDEAGTMWFTDTGKTTDRSTVLGAVYGAAADGSSIVQVARLLGPNGIAFLPDGSHVVVADTPTGRVWSWSTATPDTDTPSLVGGGVLASLPGPIALDSLAVDAMGRVVVALPGSGALAIIDGGGISLLPMPDPMPTNVCFGGAESDTAFVTLGGFGTVVAFRWPCPGARLPFIV